MVSTDQVDFRKYDLACQIGGEIVNPRNRVAIIHSVAIESTKVSARAPFAIRFRGHV